MGWWHGRRHLRQGRRWQHRHGALRQAWEPSGTFSLLHGTDALVVCQQCCLTACVLRCVATGVQKERMEEDDMFVLDSKGEVIHTPAAKPLPARPPKLSECSPLFMAVRNCPAVHWSV